MKIDQGFQPFFCGTSESILVVTYAKVPGAISILKLIGELGEAYPSYFKYFDPQLSPGSGSPPQFSSYSCTRSLFLTKS